MKWTQIITTAKAYKWWQYKVPLYMAVVYAILFLENFSFGFFQLTSVLLAFLVAIIGLAAFGHFFNDCFDIQQDALVNKYNVAQQFTSTNRGLILAALLFLAAIPWWYLPFNYYNSFFLLLQTLLLIIYSLPPIRFKEKGILGIITDALYGYTVPMLITIFTFIFFIENKAVENYEQVGIIFLTWSFLAGCRGILFHQIQDAKNDAAANVNTFVLKYGLSRTTNYLKIITLVEGICFLYLLANYSLVLLACFCIYVLWRAFQIRFMWSERFNPIYEKNRITFVRIYGYLYLNDFYEKWLGVILLIMMSFYEPTMLFILIGHSILFPNGLLAFFQKDFRDILGGYHEMMKHIKKN